MNQNKKFIELDDAARLVLSSELKAIIAGKLLTRLNHAPEAFSSKESFVKACATYEDPEHNQGLKALQQFIQSSIDSIDSNVLFKVLNVTRNLDNSDLRFYLNFLSEDQGHLPGAETGLDDLMAKVANAKATDSILDPTSGFKGAWLEILKRNPHQKVVLQEIQKEYVGLAYLNAKLTGADHFKVFLGDVLFDPKYVSDNALNLFDKVVTFPPISSRLDKSAIDQNKFNRFRFGRIGSRADYAFISNAIASLNENGKAVIAVADGPLFQSGTSGKIRERLVKDDLVETVIALPPRLLSATGIPVNLLIINKDKKNFKGKIQFINGNQTHWYEKKSWNNVLTEAGINEISKIYDEKTEADGISTVIANTDYSGSLAVKKYVLPKSVTIDAQSYNVHKNQLWRQPSVPLAQLVEIKRGYNVTKKNEKANGRFLAIKVTDIDNSKINQDQLTHINISTDPSRYLLRKNDVLLSTRGTLGKVAYINKDSTNMVASANLVVLRAKSEKINMKWLMHYLLSPMGKFEICQAASGTAVATISPTDLRNIRIPLIDRIRQDQAVKQFEITKARLDKKMRELQKQYLDNAANLFSSWNMSKVIRPTELDIRDNEILPAIFEKAGWQKQDAQLEYLCADGRRVDCVLFAQAGSPLAVIEIKDKRKPPRAGLNQSISYAHALKAPFAYSSNGDAFIEHDMITGKERFLALDEFPNKDELRKRYEGENQIKCN